MSKEHLNETAKVKPWYGLEALARYVGMKGGLMYKPRKIKEMTTPAMVTTFCLPGGSYWDGEKITRAIRPELGFKMIERLPIMQWVAQQFDQGSSLTICLGDDDFRHCFVEGYDQAIINQLVSSLALQMAGFQAIVKIMTVTELVAQSGLNYLKVQAAVLKMIEEVKDGGRSAWSQAPGWLRAVIETAETKITEARRKYQISPMDEVKISKPLVGVVIQGLALRRVYGHRESLYLATIPNSPEEFISLDVKAMMESRLPGTDFVPAIPAIFCPDMELDLQRLAQIKQEIVQEMNPQPRVKTKRPSYDYREVARLKSGKACDDLF